jgi:Maltose operon periplasmic protein precursor (MalM)
MGSPHRIFVSAITLASVLLLNACATNQSTGTQPAPRIYDSWSSVPYIPSQLNKAVEFEFDEESPTLRDKDSIRPVYGLKLPEVQGDLMVKITSDRLGSNNEPEMFYPEVRILNSAFQPLRVVAPESFIYRTGVNKNFLEATIFLNGSEKDERYLGITNRPVDEGELKVAQSNVTQMHTVSTGFAFWMFVTGDNSPPVKMKASKEGEVAVTVSEYRLKTIDNK